MIFQKERRAVRKSVYLRPYEVGKKQINEQIGDKPRASKDKTEQETRRKMETVNQCCGFRVGMAWPTAGHTTKASFPQGSGDPGKQVPHKLS